MRWLTLIAVVGLLGAGCEKTVYRSHESHYCSSTPDDEPYYECARSSDLVCINTYTMSYPQPNGAPDKEVKMWACRLACTPPAAGEKNPCGSDEVCCPGPIFGRNYGKMHACVLTNLCESYQPPTAPRDAGTGDAAVDRGRDGTGSETSPADGPAPPGEAGAPDAGADADVDAAADV